MHESSLYDKPKFTLGLLAWVIMFCSILIWGIGEVKEGTLGNTGNWYRMLLVPCAGLLGLVVVLRNASRAANAMRGPALLMLSYGVIAVLSSLYVPGFAFYSMWKGLEVVIVVLLVIGILGYPKQLVSARHAYSAILVLFGILLLIFYAEAAIMPSRAFLPSRGYLPFTFQGVMPAYNGNTLAFLSAVLTFACICRVTRAKKTFSKSLYLGLAAWAFIALIMAQSRTSLIGLFVALILFLYFDKRLITMVLLASILAIVALFSQFLDVTEQYLLRGQSDELLTTLSGRTQGWELAWDLFKQSPVVGHGFAAAARSEVLGLTGASTLHGAIFDVLVGVGLMGFIPWALAIAWTIALLLNQTKRNHLTDNYSLSRSINAEMIGIMALVLVRSSTSSGLAMHDHTFMLYLAVLAYALAISKARFVSKVEHT